MRGEMFVRLQAVDPAQRMARGYELSVGRDLFGLWVVEVRYGRLGARGRLQRLSAIDESGAAAIVTERLRRRATLIQRKDVAYVLTWVSGDVEWLRPVIPL